MDTQTFKKTVPKKESLLIGVISLEELASKLKVNFDDLEQALEVEKVPFKKIGEQIYLRIGVAKQFIGSPNHNNQLLNEIEKPKAQLLDQ